MAGFSRRSIIRGVGASGLILPRRLRAAAHGLSQPVIYDSTLTTDVGSIGGIQAMLALAKLGWCTPICGITDSSDLYSAPCFATFIQHFYGARGAVPIGAYKGNDQAAGSAYTSEVNNMFGVPGDTRANYTDSTVMLRTVLSRSVGNVVYAMAGSFVALYNFLQSSPDGISSLTGVQLAQAKLSRIVIMAGDWPASATPEHNASQDVTATQYVYQTPPVPIWTIGYTPGHDAGTQAPSGSTVTDPFAYGYSLGTEYGGGTSYCWDQLNFHSAIFAAGLNNGALLKWGGQNGTVTVDGMGNTSWTSTPGMVSYFLSNTENSAINSYLLTNYLNGVA